MYGRNELELILYLECGELRGETKFCTIHTYLRNIGHESESSDCAPVTTNLPDARIKIGFTMSA